MTIVGIVGASYCGSTLASVVLDGLPGVAAVGETHCVLDKDMSRVNNCRACGNECRYLTDAFFASLRDDKSNWWEKFQEQYGSEHIVASEKWYAIYDWLGLPDVVLLVWRDPASWCCSWLMHEKMAKCDDITLNELKPSNDDVMNAAQIWAKFHVSALAWAENKRIFVNAFNMDKFLESPSSELKRLCHKLDFEYSDDALNYADKPHHHICGNGCVTVASPPQGKRHNYWTEHLSEIPIGQLKPDFRYEKALSEDQIKAIDNNKDVIKIWDRLLYVS